MGRKSKSAKSSINNLGSKSKKMHSVTTGIEDNNDSVYELGPVPHADSVHRNEGMSSEEGFVFEGKDGSLVLMGFLGDLEEECLPDFDSESDEDSGFEEGDYQEVNNLSDLEQFSKILVEAQRVAVEAEIERLKGNHQPKHYLKNSARTKRRHKKIKKDLEKQGYFSVKDWFSKSKGPVRPDLLAQVDNSPEDPIHHGNSESEVADLDLDLDSDVEMIAANEKKCVSESASNSACSESDLVRLTV
jgi:hypothetical protein